MTDESKRPPAEFPASFYWLTLWGAWFLAGLLWLAAIFGWNLCGTEGCRSDEWQTYAWLFGGRVPSWLFGGRVPLPALGFSAYAGLLALLWASARRTAAPAVRRLFGSALFLLAGAEGYLLYVQFDLRRFCVPCLLVAGLVFAAAAAGVVRRDALRIALPVLALLAPAGFAGMLGFFLWARTTSVEAGRGLIDAPGTANPTAPHSAPGTPHAPGAAWHSIGSAQAPLEGELFYDYKCPMCRDIELNYLPILKRDYIDPGKLRFVFRHSFIPDKPEGQEGSFVCDAASYQGRFLEVHHRIYDRQNAWRDGPSILSLIQDIVDLERLTQDGRDHYVDINNHINADIEYSRKMFPNGFLVPSLLFRKGKDYRVVAGKPEFSVIQKTIDDMLAGRPPTETPIGPRKDR